jgi:hypothetical protein
MGAIDVGTRIDNMTVVSVSFDPPEVFLSCGNGHRVWSTPEILQSGGMVLRCSDCVREAQQHATRQERAKLADDLLAAGRENDQAYEDLIAEERKDNL